MALAIADGCVVEHSIVSEDVRCDWTTATNEVLLHRLGRRVR
jgi:hypothetical protein